MHQSLYYSISTPRYFLLLLTAMVMLMGSCRKFVDIPAPPDKIDKEGAFASDATASAAVAGLYSEMINNTQYFTSGFATFYAGMSADELRYYTPGNRDEFVANEITELNHNLLSSSFWLPAYRIIYAANLCIEQLHASTTLTPAIRDHLLGEAKGLRAFSYFYLVNLFGDVPLVLTTDYRINSGLGRTPATSVYEQMEKDLLEAKALLPTAYSAPDKARLNRHAATALLARVYLYQQKWEAAEREAGAVITSGAYQLVSDVSKTFLKGSTETIWQLIPGNTLVGTWEAFNILPSSATATPTYILTDTLANRFESGDSRRANWIGTRSFSGRQVRYPAKYKQYPAGAPVTEYYIVLRYAELFLIRAEARARQNKGTEALSDLNVIRQRAGLSRLPGGDGAFLLGAIERERATELFAEWGHRWLDLKRTGRATAVLAPQKAAWQPTDVLWPIPNQQLNLNSALTQNPGY